ncbi:YceI family protein [Actinocrispum wychmicini]|nr:YceI family protein [Actinocrispum wychmicini]
MGRFKRHWKLWLVGGIVLVAGGFFGVPWFYIHVLSAAPAQELALNNTAQGSGEAVLLDGTWAVADGSQAGYRVKEILFGQDTTAVGRTGKVTGTVAIAGTKITGGTVTVDMASVKSDKSGRDETFRDELLSVAQFPTATFALTAPVDFGTVPSTGQTVTVKVPGQFTLHGKTNSVTVDLTVQRGNDTLQAQTKIPVAFADYGISKPNIPGITTEDHGDVEVLLTLRKGQ